MEFILIARKEIDKDMKKIQSTCNYCAIDCNLDFYVEDNRIVKVVPTKGYPVNDGFSCIKGLSLDKQQKTVKPNSCPKIRQEDGSFKALTYTIPSLEPVHYSCPVLTGAS